MIDFVDLIYGVLLTKENFPNFNWDDIEIFNCPKEASLNSFEYQVLPHDISSNHVVVGVFVCNIYNHDIDFLNSIPMDIGDKINTSAMLYQDILSHASD